MDGMARGGWLRAELVAAPVEDAVLLRSVRVSLKGSQRTFAALGIRDRSAQKSGHRP